jgi:hypothetical protein
MAETTCPVPVLFGLPAHVLRSGRRNSRLENSKVRETTPNPAPPPPVLASLLPWQPKEAGKHALTQTTPQLILPLGRTRCSIMI